MLSQFLPRFIFIFSGIVIVSLLLILMMYSRHFVMSNSPFICFGLIGTFFFPTCLLWGASQAVPTILSVGLLLGTAEFSHHAKLDESGVVCLMVLSGFVGFYNLGHRMTFNAIPISVGFLGLKGFHVVPSVLLVFSHIFIIFIWVIILIVAVLVFQAKSQSNRSAVDGIDGSVISAMSM